MGELTQTKEELAKAHQRIEWLERKLAASRVQALLDPLPVGTEFRLDDVGTAYSSTYRKNGRGLWDQLTTYCPVRNMSADFLGFCVGEASIRKALLS